MKKNNDYLELGKVNNTHGLKGEVKFEYWCDDISYLKQLRRVYLDDRGEQALSLVSVRPQKNIAIVKFGEINSIDEAQELKNKIIYCNRNDAEIDDDAHYLADLIGCEVEDADTGKIYGKISDIMNYGSCDIYEVKDGKKTFLLPATPDVVREIDEDAGKVRVFAMKGLFDED